VTVSGGVLPDGATVDGTFTGNFGLGSLIIHLPDEPATASSIVNVSTPGGTPVSGAQVQVSRVLTSAQIGSVIFSTPSSSASGTTDLDGNFSVWGFAASDASVDVLYNDGVVTQTAQTPLTPPLTHVVLNYEPVISPSISSAVVPLGSPVEITLSVDPSSAGASSLRPHVAQSISGISVKAILPKKFAKGSCGAVLSGKTDAHGSVTLKVCASSAGVIKFTARGAYVHGGVSIFVTGDVPQAVRMLSASTPSHGTLKLSWSAPVYNGGSSITAYTVTAKCKGQKTVTMTTSSLSATLRGLTSAKKYTVTVSAQNARGSGQPSSVIAAVA
jgi:hypothetical protein